MKLIKWVFLVVIAAIFNRELAVPPAQSYPSTSSKCTSDFEKEFRTLQEHVSVLESSQKTTKEALDRMNQDYNKLDEKHRKFNKKFETLNEDHYKLRKEFKSEMSYLRSADIAESYLEYFKSWIQLLKPFLRFQHWLEMWWLDWTHNWTSSQN